MNFSHYSPYNKSYRFICFQNQAYHQRNKKNISPCVKTNIKYLNFTGQNPQASTEKCSQNLFRYSRHSNYSDMALSQHQSMSMLRSSSLTSALVNQGKRVIHKNHSYQKFRSRKINQQNVEMVNRLLNAQCQVIRNHQTERSFRNHLKYRDIRKKYNDQGARKTKMCLGNSQLLCPTLLEYNNSGMAEKFVELDLSMSMTPSSPTSRRRKRKSGADVELAQNVNEVEQDV